MQDIVHCYTLFILTFFILIHYSLSYIIYCQTNFNWHSKIKSNKTYLISLIIFYKRFTLNQILEFQFNQIILQKIIKTNKKIHKIQLVIKKLYSQTEHIRIKCRTKSRSRCLCRKTSNQSTTSWIRWLRRSDSTCPKTTNPEDFRSAGEPSEEFSGTAPALGDRRRRRGRSLGQRDDCLASLGRPRGRPAAQSLGRFAQRLHR